jgi:hypothetical protein
MFAVQSERVTSLEYLDVSNGYFFVRQCCRLNVQKRLRTGFGDPFGHAKPWFDCCLPVKAHQGTCFALFALDPLEPAARCHQSTSKTKILAKMLFQKLSAVEAAALQNPNLIRL